MDRSIREALWRDLSDKVVMLSGPRQVGKTTLARMLCKRHEYLNYDAAPHRLLLKEQSWDRSAELVVFDELHKKKDWKSWLKGVFDVEGVRPRLLVTGSARLNTYRKVGDSMAGRFFHHRLHPLDVRELGGVLAAEEAFERLMRVGGFPEPVLNGRDAFYRRWRRSHMDVILRHDLLDSENVSDLQAMETLVELLRRRVGAPVSYANLARDIEKDPKTVKRWLTILQDHYVVLAVTPYHRNVARSLLKEPKYYFFDSGRVHGDDGVKLENLVALALRKELDRLEDQEGLHTALHYLRTKDGREVDFMVVIEDRPSLMLEVKWADDAVSRHLAHFAQTFQEVPRLQLVRDLSREKTYRDGLEVRRAVPWLSSLSLDGYWQRSCKRGH